MTASALIYRVWDDDPPQRARHAALHVYLSRLRAILAAIDPAVAIVRRSGGYTLDIAAGSVDMARAEALLARARQGGITTAERADVLERAVQLWHGAPLADLEGCWAGHVRARWEQDHLDALIQWSRLRLTLGRFEAVLGGLDGATLDFPLSEPLWAARMRALVAVHRRSEALVVYESVRSRLADELGVDPGRELSDLASADSRRFSNCGSRVRSAQVPKSP